MRRIGWALAIGLAPLGCGTAGEVDPVTADSTQVRAPATADTAIAVARTTPEGMLRAELEQLVRGPSEPQPDAYSWFSSATADALRSVSVDSAGHATVDFQDLRTRIPNASSSAGSAMLLDELNAAVFRVVAVRSVDYLMDGSCERFWEWLQYGCHTEYRP